MSTPATQIESRRKREAAFEGSTAESDTKKRNVGNSLDAPIPSITDHDEFHYTMLKVLSKNGEDGKYGSMNTGIAIVQRKSDNKLLIRKTLNAEAAPLFKEIRYQRELHHKNILLVVEAYAGLSETKVGRVIRRKPTAILYVPLCNLETFHVMIDQKKMCLPEPFFWYVLQSVLEAIIYCQTGFSTIEDLLSTNEKKISDDWIPIVHLDVHTRNIFLSSVDRDSKSLYPHVLLGDFGSAMVVDDKTPEMQLYRDVYNLLSMLKYNLAKNDPNVQISEEFKSIIRVYNQCGNGLNINLVRKLGIRDIARMVQNALNDLDISYEPLQKGALELSPVMKEVMNGLQESRE